MTLNAQLKEKIQRNLTKYAKISKLLGVQNLLNAAENWSIEYQEKDNIKQSISNQISTSFSKLREITIDLRKNNFLEQPKLYKRIKNALSNPAIGQFDFELTWESTIDSCICPSSIAKFFKDSGYKVEQHSLQIQSTITNNLRIPNELFSKGQHVDSVTAHQIAEYFGFVMLDCDINSGEELNSYQPNFNLNFNAAQSRQCCILHCKGLMSSDFVTSLLETLRLSDDSKLVILNVNGERSPLKGITGNTFVILNDTKYFVLTA